MKLQIMDESNSFDVKKTLKVSGVSKLLRNQLRKPFEKKGNSTRFHKEVNRLYVCPQGQDTFNAHLSLSDTLPIDSPSFLFFTPFCPVSDCFVLFLVLCYAIRFTFICLHFVFMIGFYFVT